MPFFLPFAEGFGLGASLIIAIGAQNAFVLRLGLQRRYVFLAAAFCALADLALIAAGVFGLGTLIQGQPWFLTLMTWGGAAFLTWYGAKAARRAWRPGSLEAQDGEKPLPMAAVTATLAAFTFLNPHVYLDTVVLLGGLGARHPVAERPWFVLGASLASIFWFFGLAYGARLLTPWFRKPVTWRLLDGLIAAFLFVLAAGLVLGAVGAVTPP